MDEANEAPGRGQTDSAPVPVTDQGNPGTGALVGRLFRRLTPQIQVALCQLPLVVIVAVIAVVAVGAWPDVLGDPAFRTGALLLLVLLFVCLVAPWQRWSARAALLVPAGDLVALGFLHNGAVHTIPGLSALAVFPVIWISTAQLSPWLTAVVSFLAPWMVQFPALFADGQPTSADVTASLMMPAAMVTVWAAMHVASTTGRRQHAQLQEQDAELRRLLDQSDTNERLLRAVLATIDVGITVLDRSGATVLENRQAQDFALAAAGADGQPRLWRPDRRSLVPPEEQPARRAAEGGTFTNRLLWVGGEPTWLALTATGRPLADGDGGPDGAIVVYQDVTALVEAMAAKDEFLSDISHDFRSPLTSMICNLDLVLESGASLDGTTRRLLDVTLRNSERLLELVNELVAAASGVMGMKVRPADLSQLVFQAAASWAGPAEAAGVQLMVDAGKDVWARIDPLRISQVLDNLLSNALKYSPAGSTVSVDVSPDGPVACLSVSDTGMGMDAESVDNVFRRFYRSESALAAGIPGIGLGLAITRDIVERHGGSIACSSEPGKGTSFTVQLPAADPADADPVTGALHGIGRGRA